MCQLASSRILTSRANLILVQLCSSIPMESGSKSDKPKQSKTSLILISKKLSKLPTSLRNFRSSNLLLSMMMVQALTKLLVKWKQTWALWWELRPKLSLHLWPMEGIQRIEVQLLYVPKLSRNQTLMQNLHSAGKTSTTSAQGSLESERSVKLWDLR